MAALVLPDPARAQARATPGFEVYEATIEELQEALSSGKVTSVELVDAYLARIAAYDAAGPRLTAIVRVNPRARSDAEALDRERGERGSRGPLHGIPVILKDNFDTRDLPTSAGSIALAGVFPPDDAHQVRRLREAGAVILAKSNLHELAMGITTVSSAGGQTLNPYDLSRNPGGSSGGTGAAVAASFGAVGWGSDTCGSIRIPASFNNLFGLRQTKGLSSVDGVVPLSHTQDVAGPLARTARDLAIALDATVGFDPADPATAPMRDRPAPGFLAALPGASFEGVRLGSVASLFGQTPEEEDVSQVVRTALDAARAHGADIVEVEIPDLEELLEGAGVIGYEFKHDFIDYLAATPGAPVASLRDILDRGLFHEALESRFRLRDSTGTRDSPEYREALEKRVLLRQAIIGVLDAHELDALVYPTVRRRPERIGEAQRGSSCGVSADSGVPALSAPAGFTTDGLPVGMELLGRPFDDPRLLAIGHAFEQVLDPRRPPPATPPLGAGAERRSFTVAVRSAAGPPVGEVSFVWDPPTGQLGYRVRVPPELSGSLLGVVLGRGTPDGDGAVLHRLAGPGSVSAEGVVILGASEREDLEKGSLYVRVFTVEAPLGAGRGRLRLP